MSLTPIKPAEAKRLIDTGAILVDVREPDEHAREHIPGARHAALSGLGRLDCGEVPAVIFHCRSGARTSAAGARLASSSPVRAYLLEGGLEGWKRAGLPVARDDSQPIEIMRQVQIAAGTLVLTGVILGTYVEPGFYGLSAFVGAGLVFAGISGWCGMAKLLAFMPWNRRPRRPATAE
ncbi:MAG: DUF2892 domain-containing protein [Hyphomicrobiaceae bacterium]|nr:DUF2892 domain-containing protein [Hyphomicrobiaceae bacterium]